MIEMLMCPGNVMRGGGLLLTRPVISVVPSILRTCTASMYAECDASISTSAVRSVMRSGPPCMAEHPKTANMTDTKRITLVTAIFFSCDALALVAAYLVHSSESPGDLLSRHVTRPLRRAPRAAWRLRRPVVPHAADDRAAAGKLLDLCEAGLAQEVGQPPRDVVASFGSAE